MSLRNRGALMIDDSQHCRHLGSELQMPCCQRESEKTYSILMKSLPSNCIFRIKSMVLHFKLSACD